MLAWELMNEPRYQNATPNENTTGTTLRAWVDEMGAYVKGLDPNHMLGTGMEGQQTAYGYGGDAGNPFVYIHQSPYIDFTSGHMYPTEGWAGLTFATARTLLQAVDRRLAQPGRQAVLPRRVERAQRQDHLVAADVRRDGGQRRRRRRVLVVPGQHQLRWLRLR